MPEGHQAYADPELHDWLHWASESGKAPMFVRRVAEAALMACIPDYLLLRPVLLELKRRHPEPSTDLPFFPYTYIQFFYL